MYSSAIMTVDSVHHPYYLILFEGEGITGVRRAFITAFRENLPQSI